MSASLGTLAMASAELITLRKSGARQALRLAIADGFTSRLRGLMFKRSLPDNHALLITRCASVHTAFMRFAIDVAFLDEYGTVVRCVSTLRPWRASFGGRHAAHALELSAGAAQRLCIARGDRLHCALFQSIPRSPR